MGRIVSRWLEAVMTGCEVVPNYLDVTELSVAGFMARYREPSCVIDGNVKWSRR
jgi:hypothetical protein